MKKLLIVTIAMTLGVFLASSSFAANIAGSGHDLSSTAASEEICIVCHTPHNADTTVSDAPLWNHTLTATTGFTPYSNGTIQAIDIGQPTGVSLLCLSCHDGTVALDSFGGATGSTNIAGAALLTQDLSNDHPISFTYDTALATADGELHDPTTTDSGLGAQIDDDMLFGTNQLECASCHDVHDGDATAFLIKPNTVATGGSASGLCLTCHNK